MNQVSHEIDIARFTEPLRRRLADGVTTYVRPRYAFVRTLETNRINSSNRSWDDASYDIVDNARGSERVMARSVHYKAALEIVGALNMVEEAGRPDTVV